MARQPYQTSSYLSVCLLYDFAHDFWALPEEEIANVFNFLHQHGDTGYQQWLLQWRSQVNDYMGGKRKRSAILKKHPEQAAFFAYAQWRILQDGALVNTLLVQYGYAQRCSAKAAFVPCYELLNDILAELAQTSIYPPTPWDCGDEQKRLHPEKNFGSW